ncbi:hypothetical protein WJX74_006312 [Apatococcus lobatus]|uniref:Uncharacterized protein n=1 Tax=Apatococcus lobatus TaxID=904363 RepID=A0AAW1QMC8_9CHLO
MAAAVTEGFKEAGKGELREQAFSFRSIRGSKTVLEDKMDTRSTASCSDQYSHGQEKDAESPSCWGSDGHTDPSDCQDSAHPEEPESAGRWQDGPAVYVSRGLSSGHRLGASTTSKNGLMIPTNEPLQSSNNFERYHPCLRLNKYTRQPEVQNIKEGSWMWPFVPVADDHADSMPLVIAGFKDKLGKLMEPEVHGSACLLSHPIEQDGCLKLAVCTAGHVVLERPDLHYYMTCQVDAMADLRSYAKGKWVPINSADITRT